MRDEQHMEAWNSAKDIRHFFTRHKGEKYRDYKKLLIRIDYDQAAYGDWVLYKDLSDGSFYEEYFSIGD